MKFTASSLFGANVKTGVVVHYNNTTIIITASEGTKHTLNVAHFITLLFIIHHSFIIYFVIIFIFYYLSYI